MALQPGTTNLPSLQLDSNLTVGGTAGFTGAETHAGAETHGATETHSGTVSYSGPVSYSGTVTNTGGNIAPGSMYLAAGTVGFQSGVVGFNASVAGFDVQLPAPKLGVFYEVINQIAPASGTNRIVLPAGGTIYQGTVNGTVLNFTTVGQTARLVGLSATQYRSMQPGTTSPTVS